jgi:DNA polymerase III epsilon subunit-like protein
MIKPYTKNIIFFDTEFSSLDLRKGEILSLAFIKLNGEELYLELEFSGVVDEWPKKNILPNLTKDKVSKEQAIKLIEQFIGNDKPYVVAYVNQFDMAYFYNLFDLDNFNDKFSWIPIDYASIFFSLGINPDVLVDRKKSFFDKLQIDLSKYTQHNALDDAKLLREIYLKFSNL